MDEAPKSARRQKASKQEVASEPGYRELTRDASGKFCFNQRTSGQALVILGAGDHRLPASNPIAPLTNRTFALLAVIVAFTPITLGLFDL